MTNGRTFGEMLPTPEYVIKVRPEAVKAQATKYINEIAQLLCSHHVPGQRSYFEFEEQCGTDVINFIAECLKSQRWFVSLSTQGKIIKIQDQEEKLSSADWQKL